MCSSNVPPQLTIPPPSLPLPPSRFAFGKTAAAKALADASGAVAQVVDAVARAADAAQAAGSADAALRRAVDESGGRLAYMRSEVPAIASAGVDAEAVENELAVRSALQQRRRLTLYHLARPLPAH